MHEGAINAARQASGAVDEMLRFALEGDGMPNHPFGSQEPAVKFARATRTAAELQRDGLSTAQARIGKRCFADEISLLDQLIAACSKFLSDWSGGHG